MVVCCLENHLREKGSGKEHQGDLKSQQGYEDPPSAGDSLCPRMVDWRTGLGETKNRRGPWILSGTWPTKMKALTIQNIVGK